MDYPKTLREDLDTFLSRRLDAAMDAFRKTDTARFLAEKTASAKKGCYCNYGEGDGLHLLLA